MRRIYYYAYKAIVFKSILKVEMCGICEMKMHLSSFYGLFSCPVAIELLSMNLTRNLHKFIKPDSSCSFRYYSDFNEANSD